MCVCAERKAQCHIRASVCKPKQCSIRGETEPQSPGDRFLIRTSTRDRHFNSRMKRQTETAWGWVMTEPSSDVFCLQSGSQQPQYCQIEQLWILTQKASWTFSLIDPKKAQCNDEEVRPVFWFHYSGLHLHSICLLITRFISLAFELKRWALPSNDPSDQQQQQIKDLHSDVQTWKWLCGMSLALFWRSCLFYYSNVGIRTDDWNRWNQAGKLQQHKQGRAKFKWAFLNSYIEPGQAV